MSGEGPNVQRESMRKSRHKKNHAFKRGENHGRKGGCRKKTILNALQIKGRDTNIVVNEKYCSVIKGISMQIFQNSHVYLS